MVRFTSIACRRVSGIGVEPFCPDGVVVGTPIEVFPKACAEGTSIPKEKFQPGFLVDLKAGVYVVVRRSAGGGVQWPFGTYAILYNTPYPWRAQVCLDGDGHIVSFVTCGATSQQMLDGTDAVDVVLVPPK